MKKQNNQGYYKILNMTELNPRHLLLTGIRWSGGTKTHYLTVLHL